MQAQETSKTTRNGTCKCIPQPLTRLQAVQKLSHIAAEMAASWMNVSSSSLHTAFLLLEFFALCCFQVSTAQSEVWAQQVDALCRL